MRESLFGSLSNLIEKGLQMRELNITNDKRSQ